MIYNIIATGSKGNALIINSYMLVDCGISYAKLSEYSKNIKLVLLTHIHADHLNKKCVKKLAKEHPNVRFVCCYWLVDTLIGLGVNKVNIDVLEIGKLYNFGVCKITPILLYHNIEQCGYRIFIDDIKILYATDTNTLEGIEAKNYDYYFIESNYEDEEIKNRIESKQLNGEYIYEYDVIKNHLSAKKCNEFLLKNANANSKFIYLHGHIEREDKNMEEEKKNLDIYTDSKGLEHVIDDMANRMVYYAIVKYGSADLISKGYQKLVDRFNMIMKEINIFELISEKKEDK